MAVSRLVEVASAAGMRRFFSSSSKAYKPGFTGMPWASIQAPEYARRARRVRS